MPICDRRWSNGRWWRDFPGNDAGVGRRAGRCEPDRRRSGDAAPGVGAMRVHQVMTAPSLANESDGRVEQWVIEEPVARSIGATAIVLADGASLAGARRPAHALDLQIRSRRRPHPWSLTGVRPLPTFRPWRPQSGGALIGQPPEGGCPRLREAGCKRPYGGLPRWRLSWRHEHPCRPPTRAAPSLVSCHRRPRPTKDQRREDWTRVGQVCAGRPGGCGE